jgi:hypothetical protein
MNRHGINAMIVLLTLTLVGGASASPPVDVRLIRYYEDDPPIYVGHIEGDGGYGYYAPVNGSPAPVFAEAVEGMPDYPDGWEWLAWGGAGSSIAPQGVGDYDSTACVYYDTNPAMYYVGILAGNGEEIYTWDYDEAYFFAVAADLEITGVNRAQQQNPGGYVQFGGARQKILLNVQPFWDLIGYGGGSVWLSVTSGADKVRIYSGPTGGTGLLDVGWDLTDDWVDLYNCMSNGLYVGAVGVSSGLRDIELTLMFADPYDCPIYGNAVNFTAVRTDIVMQGLGEDTEETVGAFIALNCDDDNHNGVIDLDDPVNPNEDDLAGILLDQVLPIGLVGPVTLTYDSSKLRVWTTSTKGTLVPSGQQYWTPTQLPLVLYTSRELRPATASGMRG